MASRQDIQAGRAFVKLFLKNDLTKQMTTALRKMSTQLKAAGASMSRMGATALRVGVIAAAPFALAIKTFASFDDQMRRVQAVTGATGDMFDQLTAKAKELGATTAFTASQAADGMAFLGQAGFSAQQILEGLPAVLSLASAGAIELGEAADIASNIAGAFGLTADEIGRVSDVLATTAASTNTNILELGEAFAKAGPVAKAAGQSIEEASIAIGLLGDSGVKASVAGTDVKNILTEMAKRADIAGVKTTDAAGNVRDMLDVMKDLGGATSGLSEAERLSFFIDTFGKRSAKSAIILTSANKRIDEMREKMANASGAAKKMADIMEGGIGGSFRRVKSAIEGVAISIGESLGPVLKSIGAQFVQSLGGLKEFIEQNRGMAVSIAGVIAAVIAGGAAFLVLGGTLTLAGIALGGFATVIATIGGAIGLLFTPLGAVAALLVGGTALWGRYTSSGQAAISGLKTAFGTLLDTVRDVFGGIMDAIATGDIATAGAIAFTGLKLVALQALDAIKGLVGEAVAGIVGKLASGDITGAWTDTLKQLSTLWAAWSEGVVKTFTSMAGVIVKGWQKTVSFISDSILNLAAQPGFNTLFKLYSGVDLREVQNKATENQVQERKSVKTQLIERTERRAELEVELVATEASGNPTEDIEKQIAAVDRDLESLVSRGQQLSVDVDVVSQAQEISREDISGQADAMIAELDRVNAAAEAATKSASEAAVEAAKEGMAAVSPLIAETQAELDALNKKAAENRAKSDAKRKAEKEAGGKIKGVGADDDERAASKKLGQTQVAVSAAAAVAMSFGQQATPQADPGKARWLEQRKILNDTRELQKAIVKATKEGNTELGRFINGMVFR